jgi:peptide/nickel transport system substrate-binding protein
VGEVAFVNLNVTAKPLDDLKVRQAIAYAISRDEHLALYGEPVAENVYSVVPAQLMPGGLTQEEAEAAGVAYDQDIEKAKQLLAEAGYPDGFSIDLITSEMEAYRANYEVLQAELAQVGITVNLSVVDHATMHEQIRKDVNPIVIYVAYRPNADVYLTNFFHSDSIVVTGAKPITNFSHYAAIDDLIEQARAETDPDKQAELWKQANIQILEDAAAIPLHFQNQVYARAKGVDYGHDLVSSLALYPQITEMTTVTR